MGEIGKHLVNGLCVVAPIAGAVLADELGKLLSGSSHPAVQAIGALLGSLAPLLRQMPRKEWTPEERAANLRMMERKKEEANGR